VPAEYSHEIFDWFRRRTANDYSAVSTVPETEYFIHESVEVLKDKMVFHAIPWACVAFLKFELGSLTSLDDVARLQRVVAAVEAPLSQYESVSKVKTVGDCLIVASLPGDDAFVRRRKLSRQVSKVVGAAELDEKFDDDGGLEPVDDVFEFCRESSEAARAEHSLVRVKCGIHSGEIVGCVLGMERISYDLLGDTMNTASRLMSTAEPNTIAVSPTVHNAFRRTHDGFAGPIQRYMKGKGNTSVYVWQ
jgi:class 3 adenylate cyclase